MFVGGNLFSLGEKLLSSREKLLACAGGKYFVPGSTAFVRVKTTSCTENYFLGGKNSFVGEKLHSLRENYLR